MLDAHTMYGYESELFNSRIFADLSLGVNIFFSSPTGFLRVSQPEKHIFIPISPKTE